MDSLMKIMSHASLVERDKYLWSDNVHIREGEDHHDALRNGIKSSELAASQRKEQRATFGHAEQVTNLYSLGQDKIRRAYV